MTAGIVTGDAVPLDLRPAGWPSRALAFAIDALVQLTALTLLLGLTAFALSTADPAAGAATMLVIVVAVIVGYPVALETLTRGRTLGKAALGLRVVRDDGGPIRFRHALARALLGVFVDLWATIGIIALLSASSRRAASGSATWSPAPSSCRSGSRRQSQRPPRMPYPPRRLGHHADLSALPDDAGPGRAPAARAYTQLDPVARGRP